MCVVSLDEGGTKKSDMVNWYLKEVEGEIDTLEQLAEMKSIVEKVIDRLTHHVSVCITVRVGVWGYVCGGVGVCVWGMCMGMCVWGVCVCARAHDSFPFSVNR